MSSTGGITAIPSAKTNPNGTGAVRYGVPNMINAAGSTSRPFASPQDIIQLAAKAKATPGYSNTGY